jgi:hypothetical protein
MKVYILEGGYDWEGSEVVDVYTDEGLAQKRKEVLEAEKVYDHVLITEKEVIK